MDCTHSHTGTHNSAMTSSEQHQELELQLPRPQPLSGEKTHFWTDFMCLFGLNSYHGLSFHLWTLPVLSAVNLRHSCCRLPLFPCFGYLSGCDLTSGWVTAWEWHMWCSLVAIILFTSRWEDLHPAGIISLHVYKLDCCPPCTQLSLDLFSFFWCPHTQVSPFIFHSERYWCFCYKSICTGSLNGEVELNFAIMMVYFSH